MTDNPLDSSNYVAIGGDFTNVFDHNDYISMINSPDTMGVILRGHLILEDFLNIWCAKLTNTSDLFAGQGSNPSFKGKLNISKNLGLDDKFYDVIDRFNTIRNRYSHRRQYLLEDSSLDALRLKVDDLPSSHQEYLPCDQLCVFLEGTNTLTGERVKQEYLYKDADLNKKIMIIFVTLVMKLLAWMQLEFLQRGIQYTLISNLPTPKK
ncbi:hypothetical protein [Acinetobacter lactucae]|uniref:hypothetical protein n=1 Tax=Acinetobacter lactucae TaxID=1785128 RepID=UPI001580C117|nr:hypothetical protein [Acinetobacter lactucae]NUG24195.1 hypothetical protein [Acinetobacter lactucae]